ncbi:hypothetical protein GIB67_037047 [Kingdonia uniflora]|uniref:Uncharacterized protein n=1 Tax=Kingdonia uniflora TaxID=39325 RepID=A0A7J7LHW2_9MAGN|nr:hypothetical protein GIB67_037047 [Kingdonia uniflora]
MLGDGDKYRPRSVAAFVLGFWILDVASNMTQGPCRALVADLTVFSVMIKEGIFTATENILWPWFTSLPCCFRSFLPVFLMIGTWDLAGLSMGVLNLAIVLPEFLSVELIGVGFRYQMMVFLGSGPWDQLFGGGNSPALIVAAFTAFANGLVSTLVLRRYYERHRTRL